ncbi:MAG: hypothetical protein H0X40_09745 [Chthoniobacterales bacterium]|nr:hypothetical protein [Chthoniobacterales bacterium]
MTKRALALAPNLAEAHVALGLYYYYGYRRYDEAMVESSRATELQPNNAQAIEYTAYVHRRQGQWDRCLADYAKALESEPRNADVGGNLAETYTILRRWTEAERTAPCPRAQASRSRG